MEFTYTPNNENKNPLEEFGINLTKKALENKIDPIIGRDEEIRRVIRILSRKTKNNPILIGEPGVGKTAIVEGLAIKIITGDVPENLKNKELIELDVPSLIAGASYQGQFEKRLKDVMKAIKDSNGKYIVFIDEIHTLIGTGKTGQGGMDAAQIIKPMLARGELRLIGATTMDEHRKYIEPDPAFERRLQTVIVNEPSEEDALTILRGIKERFENYHKVKILDEALVSAVKLSIRYIPDRFLPDKAIDLIDEASSGIQTQMNSRPEELEKKMNKIASLKMEKAAIQKDHVEKDIQKIKDIDDKISTTQAEVDKLQTQWDNEKGFTEKISSIREEIEMKRIQQQKFQMDGEYEKASEILYIQIPNLEKELNILKSKTFKSPILKDTVDEKEIAEVISRWKNIPIGKLLQQEQEKLLNLKDILSNRVKGQDEALELVSDVILRSRANINDPNKPIGSFLFMGPTGVGKTEVAKSLAFELFDTENSLVRIDMSEYQEQHSVSRLIGSPPGYVGFDEGGQLTEAVRRKPYSIVLFDEIEKANPKVLDILLQILDDGRITDSRGKVVNFKNTIIIMTTNIGSIELQNNDKEASIKKLSKYLRPEFINRIDEIVTFNSLSIDNVKEIVNIELKKLQLRLKEKNIIINFDTKVINYISKNGYDKAYGARPIKRIIQNKIESPIARKIISNDIVCDKNYNITLDKNNNIEISEVKFN